MKKFLIIIPLIILTSCVGVKESRIIKRKSKIIQDSDVLLSAGSEGAVSSFNFNIRENYFFNINESVMFWWDYYAGTWMKKNDTIYLHYINNHKRDDLLDYIYIDPLDNKLVVPRIDSLYPLRLEISYNKLEK